MANYYEMSPEEEALYDMSDDELEAAVREAKKPKETLEQPIEDSNEANDTDEDGIDPSEDDESEEDIDSNDEEDNVDSEGVDTNQPDDENTEEPETDTAGKQPDSVEKYKIKANGVELDLTKDELIALAPKAMDYTKKLQEIAPWRKRISAMKDNGISDDDINMLIELKQGKKEALTALMKDLKVDPLELDVDTDVEYKPGNYGRSDRQLAVLDVVEKIQSDKEFAITQDVVDRQWDSKSRELLSESPHLIEMLHSEIKDGSYAAISAEALKLKVLDGNRYSDLEYYAAAADKFHADSKVKAQPDPIVKQEQIRKSQQQSVTEKANQRKQAAMPSSKAGRKTVVDYLDDDNDQAFDDWYKKTMSKM